MKILQILPEMNVGGVERGTADLARYLHEHGYRSIIVSNGGSLVPGLEAQGIKHYTLPVHDKNIFVMWDCVKALEKIIRDENVDIVHARSRVPAWVAYLACRKTDAEFLTTCHGYYTQHLFSHAMGWGKRVIVISEVIGRHMIENLRVQPENVRLIPRSVDLVKFAFRQRQSGKSSFLVSIVGRITPLKGHAFFLKAMAKVMRQNPYVKARIIGDAPPNKQAYKDSLLLLVKRLGIEDKVEFLGNRSDIPQIISESDVIVLSTVTQEAFGRVLIEAQAVGVPVIGTKVGGVVNIIEHEKTGLLVLPKDTDGLANAVTRIMNDKKLADAMVMEARRQVEEKYTLEKMATKTIAVYEELKNSLNILVIKLSAVGDVILATASLKALRDKYQNARIAILVGKEGAAMIHGCPYVNDVIIYDHKGRDKGTMGFFRVLESLRKFRFDKIIDFQNNNRSHLLSFLCFPKANYGFSNRKLGFLLNCGIQDNETGLSPIRHQFRVLAELGIRYDDNVRIEMWPRPDDFAYARELFHSEWIDEEHHAIVGINISASDRWPSKNWSMRKMAEFCDLLAGDNVRVIVTGMDKDMSLVKELKAHLRSKPGIFVGKTNLHQLSALVSLCKAYVTPDSAPLHVAAAMNTPVVALFGPTSPERHLPPAKKLTVICRDISCHPCYEPDCKRKRECMEEITAYEVYLEVKKFISSVK